VFNKSVSSITLTHKRTDICGRRGYGHGAQDEGTGGVCVDVVKDVPHHSSHVRPVKLTVRCVLIDHLQMVEKTMSYGTEIITQVKIDISSVFIDPLQIFENKYHGLKSWDWSN